MQRVAPLDLVRRLRRVGALARSAGRALLRSSGRLVHLLAHPRWLPPLVAWANRRRTDPTTLYAFLTLLAWSLAIGPPYGLWQFVYDLPGFSFIRASSRFTLVIVMGLAVLAAIGFDRVTAGVRPAWRRGAGALLAVLFLAECAAMPMRAVASNVIIPPIDRWLDTRPKPFVVAEVPTPRTTARQVFEQQQSNYMLHSTAHWQKTVHGYSGWRTDEHEALYEHLIDFPDEKTLQALSSFDVTYVVVHTDDYPPGEWAIVEDRIRAYYPRLRLEHTEGDGRVYSLHPAPAVPSR
jgi:hypothetical protein